jgi:signal peptidase II
VVDFLDFRWIRFPIFNVADILINMGIIGLLISNLPRRYKVDN